MKTLIPFGTFLATAASMAIAPSLSIVEHDIHSPQVGHHSTVDETGTRGLTSHNEESVPQGPTVDETSTRGQWVTSYTNKEGGPSVDETSTRGKWVSSYDAALYGGQQRGFPGYWLPTGPGYLDVDELEKGYNAHLMIMHDSSSWVHSGINLIKRFLKISAS
ncbi:hypothetical protein F4806DRAFT_369440 [Annulohypoxylon nitens]|nr:hypothetical protein F4806DRAFT_369440 [Annulohypoxylon nitens]